MIKLNNLESINHSLDLALAKHNNVVIYGEDVGYEGGVFRATKGLQAKYGENRVFDSPISEASLVGVGAGMAMAGIRPVIEMQFEGFSYPALHQLISHVSRMRNRSRGRFTMPMVVRMPCGGGIRALEHHSEALEAVFASIPGLKVVMPSTPYDTKGLLLEAIESDDPVIFFEPTIIYRAFRQEIPADYYRIPIGKALKVLEGDDLTIVTYGAQVPICQEAIAKFKTKNPNASIELIDLRSIKPWDYHMVIESVKKTGRLLVVHEATKLFSVSAEIIATVAEKCLEYLKTPCARITGYDIIIPYALGEHYYMVSPNKVEAKIKELMDYEL